MECAWLDLQWRSRQRGANGRENGLSRIRRGGLRVAIQAAVQIGWVEAADAPYAYRPTSKGREIREQAERLTDEYFFRSWSVLTDGELGELYALLSKLRGQLIVFRKAKAS